MFVLLVVVGAHETRRLWKHIEPFFRSVMSKIYLRETSFSVQEDQGSSSDHDILQLPQYSKYLLLAAFMASNNPANTDRHFFSKVFVILCKVCL